MKCKILMIQRYYNFLLFSISVKLSDLQFVYTYNETIYSTQSIKQNVEQLEA